jgi:hypothetical protein
MEIGRRRGPAQPTGSENIVCIDSAFADVSSKPDVMGKARLR